MNSMNGCCGGANRSGMNRTLQKCQNDPSNRCNEDPLYGMPLAIGYVPWQQWNQIYNPSDGLANGTIFPELNLPFCGCIPQGSMRGGRA